MIKARIFLKARTLKRLILRLRADERGNVLLLTGLSIFILAFVTGMGVDYSRAMRLQTKLNAAADAAALAAVTQPMMLNDNATATTAATNIFTTLSTGLPGLLALTPTVTVTGNNSVTSTRTVVVSYTAASSNAFAGILAIATLAIHGTSTATATAAPNIDFYLALDTSPSMALPTTSAGLARLDSKFSCTFACHSNKIEATAGGQSMPKGLITGSLQSNPYEIVFSYNGSSTNGKNGQTMYKIDSKGTYVYLNTPVAKTISDSKIQKMCADAGGNDTCVYNADGTFVDSYWYALNQGISLRVTAEKGAVGDLMSLAKSYATQNSRTYRAALYTFDYGANPYNNVKTIAPLTSSLDSITTASSSIDVVTVNDKAGGGCPPGAVTCNSGQYLFTSFQSVMNKMASDMPSVSGKGTNSAGDTPQAFLFLVTDGMSDEDIGSGRTRAPMQQAQLNQCTALKARGIKIAILYTEYTVASIQDDEPNQRAIATKAITQSPAIADQLKACASSPDLMYTVSTDQDISSALQTLFTRAVSTARLTK
jgi:Flp pilus assembly protein TadG